MAQASRLCSLISPGHPWHYLDDLVWVYKPEIGARQHHNLRTVRLRPDADSMEPTIRRGSIVIIDPTETKVPPKAIYSVRLDEEGGCAIKRVSQTDGHWVLVSDNADYPPIAMEKARMPNIVIGRVIWPGTSWVREPLYEWPAGSNGEKNGLV